MTYNVLIIDDDKELCALIKQSISKEQINSDYCYSGKDGLALLEKNNYQLILLDVMMPGMDGFQTMEKNKSKQQHPYSDAHFQK